MRGRTFLTRSWRERTRRAAAAPVRFPFVGTRTRRIVAGCLVTLAGLAVASALLLPFRSRITVATSALVLVVPITLGVAVGGFAVVPFGVAAGFLTFDFFFIPPYYTFYVTEGEDWVSLVVYACVGCTVGGVVAQLDRAQRAASRIRVLEEVDRLRAALMGSVSHDLRTPLASIKASISDLADPGLHLSEEDRATLLRTTEEETDRLTRLVANLLDMSRIQAGALAPHRSATPLDELIGAVAARLAPMFADHPLTLDTADGLPLVDVDYLLIEQVLTNLLENAARHTPPGTAVTLRAALAASAASVASGAGASGAEVEVAVVDHGPGVPEEERDRIFDEFYRPGAEGRGPAGAGMGLAIVKAIVEAHGGRIRVEPTPGGGATFAFRLPVAPQTALPDEAEAPAARR
jgi:two-component system sensor histidine kinase KdpD